MKITMIKFIPIYASLFNSINAFFHIPPKDLSSFNVLRNTTTQTITECYMRCYEDTDCDDVMVQNEKSTDLKMCKLFRKKVAVKKESCILKTFDAFSNTFIMDKFATVPITRGGNEFRYGDIDKMPYKKGEYFTYETMRTGDAGYQFFGWKSEEFSLRNITFRFSINFEGGVPKRSSGFGFKVYGVLYNDWVLGCTANTWCKVEKNVRVKKQGDKNQVILIFDSIRAIRKIHFADLTVDILK